MLIKDSLSPGIPDFRSPGTGLYNNLEKYNLPFPEAIFDIEFFKSNPKPFFVLAKDLYPGAFNPTPSHWFIRLLHEKGLLLRHYTQVHTWQFFPCYQSKNLCFTYEAYHKMSEKNPLHNLLHVCSEKWNSFFNPCSASTGVELITMIKIEE